MRKSNEIVGTQTITFLSNGSLVCHVVILYSPFKLCKLVVLFLSLFSQTYRMCACAYNALAHLIYFQYAAIFIAAVAHEVSIYTYWKQPKTIAIAFHRSFGVHWKPVFSIVFMVKRLNEVFFPDSLFFALFKVVVHSNTKEPIASSVKQRRRKNTE